MRRNSCSRGLIVWICAAVVCGPQFAKSQSTPSELPDSPSHSRQIFDEGADTSSEREMKIRDLPADFLRDQKAIWLFPTQLMKGHHWLPTLAIAGATAGLIVADPHAMPYFRTHARNLDDVNDTFDGTITSAEILLLPASVLAAGYLRHDPYQINTALLAGEAFADSAVVDVAAKAITRRVRPSDVAPGAAFNDTFFHHGTSFLDGSFPSGHAASAFSVATVLASRYRQRRWAPLVFYGFATVVSFSRVTTSAHFPSDVFVGAALGYTIARFQVLRNHE
jgi:membrane-associated phospholipid phosphatase